MTPGQAPNASVPARRGAVAAWAAVWISSVLAHAPLPVTAGESPAGGAGSAGDPTLSSPGYFPPDSVVRGILRERVGAGQAEGLVVGLLEADGTRRIVAYGRSDGPGHRPLDGATVFEIGSVTKVFTCSLLAEMAGRGEVRLDQPVAELLPRTVRVPARGDTVITLLDLATQHSGLPRLPTNLAPANPANPYADYTVERLYGFLSGYTLPRAPGARYEYSNLGMGLLGHALALRAGKPYEALLTERVLAPLGMSDTRVTLTPDQKSRLAAGHDGAGVEVPSWDLPTLAGAGALRSSANDMLRFLAAQVDSDTTALSRALIATHRARRKLGTNVMIGLAWHRLSAFGAEIVMHNGGTGGYRSFAGFDPAMHVGVVVLANTAGDYDDIGLHLLNHQFALKEVVKRTEVAVDPARLEPLVGRYPLAPGFVLTVTREGDALYVQATNQARLRAFAESDSTFFFRGVDAQVSFSRDASGRATQIVLHQMGRSTVGRREP
jgi:D-alanyl-D-alanine-carboxypeptidase/D-alanyl-D-alanine-endopeptidase